MPKKQEGALSDLTRYSGLGLQFAATIGVFALAGRWLDGRLGSSPWMLIGGVFLGFGLGLYSMITKMAAPGTAAHKTTASSAAKTTSETTPETTFHKTPPGAPPSPPGGAAREDERSH